MVLEIRNVNVILSFRDHDVSSAVSFLRVEANIINNQNDPFALIIR